MRANCRPSRPTIGFPMKPVFREFTKLGQDFSARYSPLPIRALMPVSALSASFLVSKVARCRRLGRPDSRFASVDPAFEYGRPYRFSSLGDFTFQNQLLQQAGGDGDSCLARSRYATVFEVMPLSFCEGSSRKRQLLHDGAGFFACHDYRIV